MFEAVGTGSSSLYEITCEKLELGPAELDEAWRFGYHLPLDLYKLCLLFRLNLDRGLDAEIGIRDVGLPSDLGKALRELVGPSRRPRLWSSRRP